MKKTLLCAALVCFMIAFAGKTFAQKNQIEKVWYDEKKTCKVQIYLAKDGKYYGKMIWLSEPIDKKTGNPQVDKENPNEKLRNVPLQDMVILSGFTPDPKDPNVYTGGSVYDPDSGKTYCGKITFKGKELDMRGYICSFSLFGRTETWTLAN
ncbi:MAG: hypothetical protein JWO06_975 [Bacteroidota bacterium]|nr:hypothetical protein [Bacteroidota bacterium]